MLHRHPHMQHKRIDLLSMKYLLCSRLTTLGFDFKTGTDYIPILFLFFRLQLIITSVPQDFLTVITTLLQVSTS